MTQTPTDHGTGEAKLDFWFEFASTYSYLSATRMASAAAAAGVTVTWRPFLLGPIFAAQGWTTSPFNLYPAKGRYMWRDMARLAAARGVDFVRPDVFPQNGLLAARVATALLNEAPATGQAFCVAIYKAQFAKGLDISNPDVVSAALDESGAPEGALAKAQDPAVKAQLRATTETAQEIGLFGAPSFTIGDEIFWGDDRLEMALAHARAVAEASPS